MASGYSTCSSKDLARGNSKRREAENDGVGMGCSPHLSTAEALGVRRTLAVLVRRDAQQSSGQGKFQCLLWAGAVEAGEGWWKRNDMLLLSSGQ